MKRSPLVFHRYLNDEPIRLARILGREMYETGGQMPRFRYAFSEDGKPESRFIQPVFSRALRYGPHTFLCAPGLYHNINSRVRKIEKDKAHEYNLVFDLPYQTFARHRSLNRFQALEAAALLDQQVTPLDIYRRLFPDEIPGADE